MIPASLRREETVVEVSGGTDVAWSPPGDYLRNVTLPVLRKCGLDAELDILRRGYYPAGGGKLRLTVEPSGKNPLELNERGRLLSVHGVSHAHEGLREKEVAERQKKSCRKTLFDGLARLGLEDAKIDLDTEYADAASLGSGAVLWAQFENTVLGADSLGEKGKRAEDVGREAAENLLSEINSGAPVDKHTADQIVPYLALFGGSVRVPALSKHAETNLWVARKFGARAEFEGGVIRAEPLR
jgi:RNA 3'-phosphate cyclase